MRPATSADASVLYAPALADATSAAVIEVLSGARKRPKKLWYRKALPAVPAV